MFPPAQSSASASQRPYLLLVEDNALYREIVAAALAQCLPGWQVLEAGCVKETLAQLGNHPVRVMLADMTLPDGSAIDLVERSGEFIRHGLRTVVFSNHPAEEMLPLLERSGVHHYVDKAQGLKALAQAVQAAIDHSPHALPLP